MRNKTILFILLASVIISLLNAEILRVNNNSGAMAPYTDIYTAHNDAVSGDTILVEGSLYTSMSPITKQISVLGSATIRMAGERTIISADSVIVSGLDFLDNTGGGMLNWYFNGNHNTIKNSKRLGNKPTIKISGSDNFIFHNWDLKLEVTGGSPPPKIYNNYLYSITSNNDSILVFNNVISSLQSVTNSHIYNNIIVNINQTSLLNSYNYVIKYNIFGCPCPEGSGLDHPDLHNIFDVDLNDIFTYGTGFEKYKLIPNCDAVGTGLYGDDCGMFGGNCPFPGSEFENRPFEIPKIHSLEVNRPDMLQDTLNIIFEAKTHPRP